MIVIPIPITRSFIQNHPEYIFIYGYDQQHKGIFGQAWEAHGEPNTFPVYTCLKMCKSSGFYQDSMYDDIVVSNSNALLNITVSSIGRPVISFPKIGRGYSRMFEFAPRSYKWLMDEIDKIKYPNIKYINI